MATTTSMTTTVAANTADYVLNNPYQTNVSYQQQWKEYLDQKSQPHIVIYDVLVVSAGGEGPRGLAASSSWQDKKSPEQPPTRSSRERATRGKKVAAKEQQEEQSHPTESDPASSSSMVIILACGSNGTVYVWEVPESLLGVPNSSSDDNGESDEGMEWRYTDSATDTWNNTNTLTITSSNNKDDDELSSYLLHPRHVWKLLSSNNNSHEEEQNGYTVLRKMQIVTNTAASTASSNSSYWCSDATLFVAGDECGILVFKLDDLVQYGDSTKPMAIYKSHCSSMSSYKRYNCSSRTRDFMVWDNRLIAVVQESNDNEFGLYQWDISTQSQLPFMVPPRPPPSQPQALSSSHRRFVRPVGTVTAMCHTSRGLLLLGTNTGLVGYVYLDNYQQWMEPVIHLMDLLPNNLSDVVVTCVVEVDQYWWVVAGECVTTTTTTANASHRTGFIASLHVPTQSLLKIIQCRDIPHKLLLHKNDNSQVSALISISNTSVVRFWHPVTLEAQRDNWCTTTTSSSSIPSCYAVTTASIRDNDDDTVDVVIVGGVGNELQVCCQSTRILALSCQRPNNEHNMIL